jgi:hypothetical protein
MEDQARLITAHTVNYMMTRQLCGFPKADWHIKGEFDSHISVNKMLINAESTFEAIQDRK